MIYSNANTPFKRRIASIVTVCYWLATVPLAWLSVEQLPNWFGVAWFTSVLFFALPVTAILWIIVLIDRRVQESQLTEHGLIAVGVAIPIIYSLAVFIIPHEREARANQRVVEQASAAIVDAITDEVLIDSKGPIGVRLSYRVTYPKGMELDAIKAPKAYLVGEDSEQKAVSLLLRTRVVTPKVLKNFPVGTFTITDDFLPAFMPSSLLPATDPMSSPAAHSNTERQPVDSSRCYRWANFQNRANVERISAKPFNVEIFTGFATGEPTAKSKTSHVYRMADFLATADREGSRDCVP